jgi:hypothetical protein
MKAADWEDAYQYYYGFKDFNTGESAQCVQKSVKERKKCDKELNERLKERNDKYRKKMKGFKMLYKR